MHKLKITYRMAIGTQTAESYIELPCTGEYYEAAKGKKSPYAITRVLIILTILQGYRLVDYSINFDEEA